MQTTTTHDVVGRRPVCVPTSDPCCDMLSHPRNHSSQLGPWYWRGAGSSCQQQVQATDWHVTKLRNPAMRSFVYSVLKCVGVCLRLCGEPQQLSKKLRYSPTVLYRTAMRVQKEDWSTNTCRNAPAGLSTVYVHQQNIKTACEHVS